MYKVSLFLQSSNTLCALPVHWLIDTEASLLMSSLMRMAEFATVIFPKTPAHTGRRTHVEYVYIPSVKEGGMLVVCVRELFERAAHLFWCAGVELAACLVLVVLKANTLDLVCHRHWCYKGKPRGIGGRNQRGSMTVRLMRTTHREGPIGDVSRMSLSLLIVCFLCTSVQSSRVILTSPPGWETGRSPAVRLEDLRSVLTAIQNAKKKERASFFVDLFLISPGK